MDLSITLSLPLIVAKFYYDLDAYAIIGRRRGRYRRRGRSSAICRLRIEIDDDLREVKALAKKLAKEVQGKPFILREWPTELSQQVS